MAADGERIESLQVLDRRNAGHAFLRYGVADGEQILWLPRLVTLSMVARRQVVGNIFADEDPEAHEHLLKPALVGTLGELSTDHGLSIARTVEKSLLAEERIDVDVRWEGCLDPAAAQVNLDNHDAYLESQAMSALAAIQPGA
jgi:hypothetical protein